MRNTKEVTINGKTYTLHHLPAVNSFKKLTKLLKIVGGPLGSAASQKTKSMGDLDMSGVLSGITASLDSPDAHELLIEIVGEASYKGKKLKAVLDTHFAGDIGSMVELFIEAIKFEYSDVFQKIVSLFQGAELAVSQNTTPQST